MSVRYVLASDLDGTLADGSDEARAELLAWLRARDDARLVYVTGRAPESARELMQRATLPPPDVLIADVGTTVLEGPSFQPLRPIEAEIARDWPGADVVRERLAPMDSLTLQEVDAPRRVSWWIEPVRSRRGSAADPFAARAPDDASMQAEAARIAAEVGAEAAERLAPLAVDVLVSANVFLDVLPRGVNKGSTLLRVLDWLGAERESCIVAGDSLNDLALFATGLRGIVVGNCEPALAEQVNGMGQVYRAQETGAGGVLEGLRHHRWFD
jgi:hydroxymethylpyrimidine pyrophosphatase-like HAD family hydrolase